jgi:hypothetical protein
VTRKKTAIFPPARRFKPFWVSTPGLVVEQDEEASLVVFPDELLDQVALFL